MLSACHMASIHFPGTKQVNIPVENGNLEAEIHTKPADRSVGVIICHPYSLLGGSMTDYVVSELFNCCARNQDISVVLKYNQRGVGKSTGSRNIFGKQDAMDLPKLVEFLLRELSNGQVIIIGYSWGACLATHALEHPNIAVYVGVSFPLGGVSNVLSTRQQFDALCTKNHLPRLLVMGDSDQFSKARSIEEAVVSAKGGILAEDDSFMVVTQHDTCVSCTETPLVFRLFKGNDHFWSSDCNRMAEYVITWAVQNALKS